MNIKGKKKRLFLRLALILENIRRREGSFFNLPASLLAAGIPRGAVCPIPAHALPPQLEHPCSQFPHVT